MGNCVVADTFYTGTYSHAIRTYAIERLTCTACLGVGEVVFSAGADSLGMVAYEGLAIFYVFILITA